MTEEEMDELGAKYHETRKMGEYSGGYITVSFDDIPANGVIQIPAGTQAESKQGYRYRSTETVTYTEAELFNVYDTDEFLYKIPVWFEAENPGAEYDVAEGDITSLVNNFDHLSSVYNEISFTGGKSQETNLEFANRIKETANAPNLGVERGWIRFANSFPEVEGVIVAGFGHPLMQRDVVGITPPGRFSSAADPNVHWGGKVDLHIRGSRLVETVDAGTLTKQPDGDLVLKLSKHPVNNVAEITFASGRYTDPDLDEAFFVVTEFRLEKNEDRETIGTLKEEAEVIIMDDRLEAGDTVYVRYYYNSLIEDMTNELYTEENRPPGSDVMIKEARKRFVHAGMIIRLDTVIGIKEKDKSIIRQRLYNWIKGQPLGTEMQFSDMNAPLYEFSDDSIDTKVDYIAMPAHFLVTENDDKYLYYCLSGERKRFLDEIMNRNLYFKKWIPYFKDNVTIYEFFDIFHILTYSSVEKDAWKNVSNMSHEWGKKVYYIELSKRMAAYTNTLQRLSPAKWQSQSNDYFELGNFSIYEDIKYTSTEIQDLVNLYTSIANPDALEPNITNILHLTVYCATLLYAMSYENPSDLNVAEFFEWLIDLTKGTPIDYDVNQ